jgi:hypothetical protein
MSQASFSALEYLAIIVSSLEKVGKKTLSATKLKRTHGFSDRLFLEAIEYGTSNKIIKRHERNLYSFVSQFTIPEEAYYPSVEKLLDKLWVGEKFDKSQFYIERTARKNSKIAGPWTRPDFTMVSYKKFPWTIGSEFDVVTFEVKRADTCNVLAVFEALSHVSVATRAYVVFPKSEVEWVKSDPAQAQRVKEECLRHGVGLILIDDMSDNGVPVHLIRAPRKEIDHARCSSFLAAVLSEDGKDRIAQWK